MATSKEQQLYYDPFLSSRVATIFGGQLENPAEVGCTPWSAAGPPASLPKSPAKLRLRPAAMWGRLAGAPSGSGGLSIRLPAASTMPENRPKSLRLAAMRVRQSCLSSRACGPPIGMKTLRSRDGVFSMGCMGPSTVQPPFSISTCPSREAMNHQLLRAVELLKTKGLSEQLLERRLAG